MNIYSKMDCNICYDTVSIDENITCLVCSEKACLECYKTYFLLQTTALCMWCKNRFNISTTLKNKYPDKVLKEFIIHFDTFVFDIELSKAKDIDESIIYNIKNQNNIKSLKESFKELYSKETYFNKRDYNTFKEKHTIIKRTQNQKNLINRKYETIPVEHLELYKKLFEIETERDALKRVPLEKTKSSKIRRPYPQVECQGVLFNFKCMTCDVILCKECHEIETEKHTCKPENIESIKMLEKDTKPCPGCCIAIIKTKSCHHMFCTSCHTFFAWNTLRIYDKPVGNPEYYRFLQSQNKTQNENEPLLSCNTDPSTFYNNRDITRLVMNSKATHHMVSKTYSYCNHILFIIEKINKYLQESDQRKNIIRVGYLLNNLSKQQYRKRFFLIRKNQLPVVQFLQACETMRNTFPDLFFQIKDLKDNDKIKCMIENFTLYFIDELKTLCDSCSQVHNFEQYLDLKTFKKQFNNEEKKYFTSEKKKKSRYMT